MPPQLPSEVEQVYLPVDIEFESAVAAWSKVSGGSVRSKDPLQGSLVYAPGLVGLGTIYYAHAASRHTFEEDVAYLLPAEGDDLDWSTGRVQLAAKTLVRDPMEGAFFADLPRDLGTAKKLAGLQDRFEDYLAFNSTFALRYNSSLKLYSQPGEDDDAFTKRCWQEARKGAEADRRELTARIKTKLDSLQAKIDREERNLETDRDKLSGRKQEELLSGAETVIGLFSGRKKSSALSSASRRRRMTKEAKARVEESEQTIKDLEAQIDELEGQAKQEEADLVARWKQRVDDVQKIDVRPRRSDVRVNLFALAWIPRWEVTVAGRTLELAAYQPAKAE